MPQRQIGEKVRLEAGGMGGLNFQNLVEQGCYDWTQKPPNVAVPILDVKGSWYTVQLPSGQTMGVREQDLLK